MPALLQEYRDPKFGVINAIRDTQQPVEGLLKCQNMYFRENEYQKLPGFTELHSTQIADSDVLAVTDWVKQSTQEVFTLAVVNGSLYKKGPKDSDFVKIQGGFTLSQQVEFLHDRDNVYFGSDRDDRDWETTARVNTS